MERLIGKVAVVVGGGSGIGAAAARLMAAEGASVVVGDINSVAAEGTVRAIREHGGVAESCLVDISDEIQVTELMRCASDAFGGVDILHNSAAALSPDIIGPDKATDVLTLDLRIWDRTMAVNLYGSLLTCRHAVPMMLERGAGSIINTTSPVALLGQPTTGAYAVSKAGVIGLTRHIAAAYGKRNIRCNAVAPGRTPGRPLGEHAEWVLHNLTPRLPTPNDLANAILFLASDESQIITGQVLYVDGGLVAHMPDFADDAIRGR